LTRRAQAQVKPDVTAAAGLADEVGFYLSQSPRQLPSSALYDALGSALFEAICLLPWYPITRAERGLIARHRADILAAAERPRRLVELGPGSGEKLDLLLGREGEGAAVRRVDLVDVSAAALAEAERRLGEGRTLDVATHLCRYEDGLGRVAATRAPNERLLVLFLGSNVGNFDPPAAHAFLAALRATLCAGDHLLIGADLVKSEETLRLAYDDPLGITAAFNKNLLVRLNRELGATFDVRGFDHRAVWNATASRVEMHLVSRRRQRVRVDAAGLTLEVRRNETIWTESSYKYEVGAFEALLRSAGLAPVARWLDEDARFLLTVARAGR
jgi:dimethylhistidine N-methyltransferase